MKETSETDKMCIVGLVNISIGSVSGSGTDAILLPEHENMSCELRMGRFVDVPFTLSHSSVTAPLFLPHMAEATSCECIADKSFNRIFV